MEPQQELLFACKYGNLQTVIRVLNPDISSFADEYGYVSYYYCNKVDVSYDNELPFRLACINGHLNIAQWLLQYKPTTNTTAPFVSACRYGQLHIIKWLLQINPSIISSHIIIDALYKIYDHGHIDLATYFLTEYPNIYSKVYSLPLLYSCSNGNLILSKLLLHHKPNVLEVANIDNIFRSTCEGGCIEVAKWLMSIKPSINIYYGLPESTALTGACEKGHLNIVIWLYDLHNNNSKMIGNEYPNEKYSFMRAWDFKHLNVVEWFCKHNPIKYYLYMYKSRRMMSVRTNSDVLLLLCIISFTANKFNITLDILYDLQKYASNNNSKR
jgi:hypothetical protein